MKGEEIQCRVNFLSVIIFLTIKKRIFKSEFELTANSYEDGKRSYS
jgi:hypothetical protein